MPATALGHFNEDLSRARAIVDLAQPMPVGPSGIDSACWTLVALHYIYHANRSLVLTMELCKQLSEDGWDLSVSHFSMAVYYGTVVSDEERFEIQVPDCLTDISVRWRMFYFHH